MPPAGFEPTVPASDRPQTNTLEGAVTGIGLMLHLYSRYLLCDNRGLFQIYHENILCTSCTSSSAHLPRLNIARHLILMDPCIVI